MADTESHAVEQSFLELLLADEPVESFSARLRDAQEAGASEHELAELQRLTNQGLTLRAYLEELRRRERELRALYATAGDLSSMRGVEQVLQAIVRRARQLLATDVAYITLIDEQGSCVYVRVADGALTEGFRALKLQIGLGLGGLVAQTGHPYLTEDFQADARIVHEAELRTTVQAEGLVAVLGVPLSVGEQVIGVLYAADRRQRSFSSGDAALLGSLGAHAAIALDNARLFEESRVALDRSGQMAAALEVHTRRVERLAAVDDLLLAALLTDGSPAALAAALSGLLDAPVLVLDADGRCMVGAPEHGEPGDAAQLAERMRAGFATASAERCGTLALAPILVAGELLGAVAAGAPAEDDAEPELLERAALVMAVALLQRRSIAEAEHRVRRELLSDLITGSDDLDGLRRRAEVLGVKIDRAWCMVVADATDMPAVRRVSRAAQAELGGLVGEREGHLVMLLPWDSASAAARRVGLLLRPADPSVTVAAAGPVPGPADLGDAYQRAVRTVQAMAALGRTGQDATAEQLGIFGLLLSGVDADAVRAFLASAVGPLVAYDDAHRTDLVRTLEEYFRHSGNVTQAARALHVHVNTLYQRLERIKLLLGDDWQDADRALHLSLALRLRHLIELL